MLCLPNGPLNPPRSHYPPLGIHFPLPKYLVLKPILSTTSQRPYFLLHIVKRGDTRHQFPSSLTSPHIRSFHSKVTPFPEDIAPLPVPTLLLSILFYLPTKINIITEFFESDSISASSGIPPHKTTNQLSIF